MPGYRHKIVLCSNFEYQICNCVHSYPISPCQTPIFKFELSEQVCARHNTNFATLRIYIFASFQQITFKLGNFRDILRRSFQWCRRIFHNLSMSKVGKNRGKVHFGGQIRCIMPGRCTNGESNLLLSLVPFCVVSKGNPNHCHRSIQELYKT